MAARPDNRVTVEQLEREDLVLFINACFACTGQREFYTSAGSQRVSVDFLHQYTMGNYRRLYARSLALGLNDFNRAMIVRNLLASGSPDDPDQGAEENKLLTATLAELPPPRVYRLFESLAASRVNNRRTRAVMRRFVLDQRDVHFDAVKYRRRLRVVARHAHVPLDSETARFLRIRNRRYDPADFTVPLFRTYAEAGYSNEALFDLPFSVAEGLAADRGITQKELLRRGQRRMTHAEKLRSQARAERAEVDLEVDLDRMPLTRLATFVLSLDPRERTNRHVDLEAALSASADRTYRRAPVPLGRVAVIADRSYSTTGSFEKRNRSLAVALGASYLLMRAADECSVFWAPSLSRPHIEVTAKGQTDLTTPLLAAMRSEPDMVIILSDGYENAPAGLVGQVVAVSRQRIPAFQHTSFIHLNPVFDPDNLAPRTLGAALPTVGVRNAEDVLSGLGFARFADGSTSLGELEEHMAVRAKTMLRSMGTS